MTSPLFQKINPSANGRRLAIGDIHGCLKTLQKLVWEHIQLDTQDQLFFLGDYIDRGPDGAGVIDFIMDLQSTGYQVYPLRGNHEQMLLDAWTRFQDGRESGKRFIELVRDPSMVDTTQNSLIPRFEQWLNQLPYYYELDKFYLVHAGFNLKKENPFEHTYAMLWTMSFNEKRYIADKAHHKTIVIGHQKTPFDTIKDAIHRQAKVILLDNGCYKHDDPTLGQLCALNLDDWTLYSQKNMDY
ncbi:hypothetical protein BKI52_21250 [marine bacterium AO1-C]|nr:hypothetical protein BKI52_21250 [marine bacterium AO1-C]